MIHEQVTKHEAPNTKDGALKDAAKANYQAYLRLRDNGHEDFVADANKFENYYRGEQWDPADKKKLEEDGRPALTVNAILATVNSFVGEMPSQRADMVFRPKRRAQLQTAEVLTQLVKQIRANNQYEHVETQAFTDGAIMDRGFMDFRLDFSDHVFGEVRITSKDPRNILIDAEASEYDPSTWNEVIETRWLTVDEIALFYGEAKAEKLRGRLGADGQSLGADSMRYDEKPAFGDADPTGNVEQGEDTRPVRRVRIIERQWRKMGKARFFVDNQTGDLREIPAGMDEGRVKTISTEQNMSVISRLSRRVRWTVSADDVMLHDDWSPYATFTIVPYFPYFRRGKPFGVVRNLVSPQDNLNKVESQILHVVNTTANSGWIVEAGALVNMTEQELEEKGAQTGLVLVHSAGRAAPMKITSNGVPPGLENIGRKALSFVREISGTTAMLGIDSGYASGSSLEKKQARGAVQQQVPFDNLALTRLFVARKIVELVQHFYTEERVIQITHLEGLEEVSEEISINSVSPEGEAVNDVTLGEYMVDLTSAPARDSYHDAQFRELLELREMGVMIPDDILVESSNYAKRHEVANRLRELMGQAEPTEEEVEMMQMQQQLAIQGAMLGIEKLQAEVQKMNAESALAMSKAQAMEGEAGLAAQQFAGEMQARAVELEGKLQIHYSNLENKLQLAEFHGGVKQDLTRHQIAAKGMQGQLQNRTNIAIAGMKASKAGSAARSSD